MTSLNILLQAAVGADSAQSISSIVMMVAVVAIFYFFMIRPQAKKQKEIRKFREGLKTNDKIITAGGIYGRIKDIKEDSFIVEIADNIRIRIDKNSVYASAEDSNTQNTK